MAKVTIITTDSAVYVDNYWISEMDVSSVASNIHAIQWDGSNGHIEYNDGKTNEEITDISPYQSLIDDHATKKAEQEAANQAEADALQADVDAQTALEATYGWKREQEYPPVGDQLDALYHAGTFDATMTATLKAVKDKYPKP